MSSKSNLASSRRRAGIAALGLVLLVGGGYGLYAAQTAQAPDAAAVAGGGTPERVTRDLATDTLAAFVVHPERKPVAEITFGDAEGNSLSLSQWKGRVVLVNLWATWCGPCRKEMPGLDRMSLAQRVREDGCDVRPDEVLVVLPDPEEERRKKEASARERVAMFEQALQHAPEDPDAHGELDEEPPVPGR
mgnify:CR=1 FL=1